VTETRERIVSYLGDQYAGADDELIDAYVQAEAILKRMQVQLAGEELLYEYTNKAGATNKIKNPLLMEIPRYTQTLNMLLKALGLTAAQRKKVVADDEADDPDFD
jgi:hypothetical protein